MNSDRFKDRSIPILIFITTIVAYGLLLPKTGFYWDDWPFAWIAQFLGPKQFIPSFEGVRPFLGPIFLATTSLIPPVPIYWQIFALLIRFLAGLSAWFALSQAWPRHKLQVLVTSLLFLVFPGYSQHWVAFTHINQEWIPLIFLLLSFGLTGYALRHSSSFRVCTIAALLLLIPGIFPTEYFFTQEVLRLLFIWVIIREQIDDLRQSIIRSIKSWLPYFFVWLANALWLAYFYTLGSYDSYDVALVREPLSLVSILATIGDAIWKIGFYIWGQIIILVVQTNTAPSSLLTLLLIAIAFVFFAFYLSRFDTNFPDIRSIAVPAMFIGIVGIIAGRIPSLAAALPLRLQSSFDRFTISMMLGGSLFIVGIVELLVRNARARTYIFASLIALSIGQQFFNANIFRRDWEKQQEIFWQLAWRIPAMKPGTALLTNELPVDYETDLSFTAPLNWMYDPEHSYADLPYALIYTETRLGGPSLPSLVPGIRLTKGMRGVNFQGTTSQVIVIYMPTEGCLRVLDPSLGDELTYAGESHDLVDAIPLSKPQLILVNSNHTPRLPFLAEPKHTWCYYYAKAELARQKGDWQQINNLFDTSTSLGYSPNDSFEWLVFIESFAKTDNIDIAQKLSDDAMESDGKVRRGLCQVWKRVQAQGPMGNDDIARVSQILQDFKCIP